MKTDSPHEQSFSRFLRCRSITRYVSRCIACLILSGAALNTAMLGATWETLAWDKEASRSALESDWQELIPQAVIRGVDEKIRVQLAIQEDVKLTKHQRASGLGQLTAKGDAWIALMRGNAALADGNPPSDLEGLRSISEAAEKGLGIAYLRKAEVLRSGSVRVPEPNEVELSLKAASARGVGAADRLLANTRMILDEKSLLSLLERGSQKGDARSTYELGLALLKGVWKGENGTFPVSANPEKGRELLKESFYQGEIGAAAALVIDAIGLDDQTTALNYLTALLSRSFELGIEPWVDAIPEEIESGRLPLQIYEQAANAVSWKDDVAQRLVTAAANGDDVHALPGLSFHPISLLAKRSVREVEIEIKGSEAGPVLNLMSIPLPTDRVAQGSVLSVSHTSAEVDLSYLPFFRTRGQPEAYYLEIPGEGNEGYPVPIRSDWDFGNTVRLAEDVRGVLQTGQAVTVRRWRSLFQLFGELNRAGLKPGLSASEADEVMLFDAASQKLHTFFFHAQEQQWHEAGVGALAEDVMVLPWEGILVRRKDPSSLFLSVSGDVTEPAGYAEIYPGTNLLANRGAWKRRLAVLQVTPNQEVAVRDALVAEVVPKEGEWTLLQRHEQWWEPLGLSPDEPLYISDNGVLILAEDPERAPYSIENE